MIIQSPHTCTVQDIEGRSGTAECQWIYDDECPFLALLIIPAGNGTVREWAFAHELLHDGLHTPTGLGDVRIWPDGDRLCVELQSPTGHCRLTTDWEIARRFVQDIYDQAWNESRVLQGQIDQGLASLLKAAS